MQIQLIQNLLTLKLEFESQSVHVCECKGHALSKGYFSHVGDHTSLRFCRRSSSLSLALLGTALFLSASYWRWVLSMLMLRFRATFTSAVISFMAVKRTSTKINMKYNINVLTRKKNITLKHSSVRSVTVSMTDNRELQGWCVL